MDITRELATAILSYLKANPEFYFPFEVMCKEVDQDNRDEDDEDYVWLSPEDLDEEDGTLPDWYQTFQLRENVQTIDLETLELLFLGFKQKINGMDTAIWHLAEVYAKMWEEYGNAKYQYKEKVTDIDFIGEWKAGTEDETFERGYVRGLEFAMKALWIPFDYAKLHDDDEADEGESVLADKDLEWEKS